MRTKLCNKNKKNGVIKIDDKKQKQVEFIAKQVVSILADMDDASMTMCDNLTYLFFRFVTTMSQCGDKTCDECKLEKVCNFVETLRTLTIIERSSRNEREK